jgi:glycosyltransferase involved in cell wall biosynthesis
LRPLVSVIMPVHNGAPFLRGAVESVFAQGWRPVEVVVVDDGSTDETPAIARDLGERVQLLRQANAGPAAARNAGIRAARGPLIAFLDVDDLWPPGKLDVQAAYLVADPSADMVLGRTKWIALEATAGIGLGTRIRDLPGPEGITPCLGNAVVRRRVFNRIGFFDETLRTSEDLDWFIRAKQASVPTIVLTEVTLLYRRHEGNMTARKGLSDLRVLEVIKRSLDRRRAARRSEGEAA